MTRRDRLFVLAVVGLTALVPVPLAVFRPLAEGRAALGTLAGWGLALLMMVPSYALLTRAMTEQNPHRFVTTFMTGTMLRLFLTIAPKLGTSRLAPPTSAPSTSGSRISSAMLSGLTLPP